MGEQSNNNCTKTLVYLTRHALTQGIITVSVDSDVVPDHFDTTIVIRNQLYYALDWHTTPLCAISRAEEMRATELKFLQASLAKVEALIFNLDSFDGTY